MAKTVPKVTRYTDKEMVAIHRQVEKLEAQRQALSAQIDTERTKILEEFRRRRGTHVIEHGGIRLTYVRQMMTRYDEEGILRHWSAKRKRLLKRVFDTSALSRMVQAGEIDKADLDPYTEIIPKKPYYVPSDVPR